MPSKSELSRARFIVSANATPKGSVVHPPPFPPLICCHIAGGSKTENSRSLFALPRGENNGLRRVISKLQWRTTGRLMRFPLLIS